MTALAAQVAAAGQPPGADFAGANLSGQTEAGVNATASTASTTWADARLAAMLFAVDPAGLGGVAVTAQVGPPRAAWLALLRTLLPPDAPQRRIPCNVADDRLLGGLDLAATLAAGRPIAERGLLAEADGGVVVLAMAERLPPGSAARLTAVLDRGEVVLERDGLTRRSATRFGVVALNEAVAEDEGLTPGLLDRLAFHLDLREISLSAARSAGSASGGPALAEEAALADAAALSKEVAGARRRLPQIEMPDEILQALCAAAAALGVDSPRACLLALRTARAAAALDGEISVMPEAAALAARLVLSPRATRLPAPDLAEEPSPEEELAEEESAEGAQEETQSQTSQSEAEKDQAGTDLPLDDLLIAAAETGIPEGLLAALRADESGRRKPATSGTVGAYRESGQRGRPLGVRPGDLRAGGRLNLVATLRAAAPWQPLRRKQVAGEVDKGPPVGALVHVRPEDFRVTCFRQRRESTTLFLVDASGSAALARLAEAKGAVEMLLADCYLRRDQVALLAFRGKGAELLLPPTRSLVRAKRSLAGLLGGGGTPLARGLESGYELAEGQRRKGRSAVLVVLTDGKANLTRDGSPDRSRAEEETLAAARRLRAAGVVSLLVDTSPRPQERARRLAAEMGARYLPLPYADAAGLARAIRETAPE